jgi:hypothetical protein
LSLNRGTSFQTINTQDLSKGIYFIEILTNEGKQKIKFVKNKTIVFGQFLR